MKKLCLLCKTQFLSLLCLSEPTIPVLFRETENMGQTLQIRPKAIYKTLFVNSTFQWSPVFKTIIFWHLSIHLRQTSSVFILTSGWTMNSSELSCFVVFVFFFTDGGKSCFQACSHAMVVLPCETDADGSLSHRCLLLFPREESTWFPLFVLAPAFLASVPSATAQHSSPLLVDRFRCGTADMEEEYFLQET